MSITPNPTVGPDRDSLPFKKRDQRMGSPQQSSDAAIFKAPYPCKSYNEFKTTHPGPFRPIPRQVPALYQPWVQTHTSPRTKPHIPSHRDWAEWKDSSPLHLGWDLPQHHHNHFSEQRRAVWPPGLHPGYLHHPSKYRPISLVTEAFHWVGEGYRWEAPALREQMSLNTERQTNGRNKAPYMKRPVRKMENSHRGMRANPPSLSTRLPHPPIEDLTPQYELMRYKHHSSGAGSSVLSSSQHPSATTSPLSSPSSPDHFPWLLPHFGAGSLIELRDGRLRRVEDLQTEDFLLGSLACQDLRLSCCTVQSIAPSASSSSLSRLLILLHDQHSQELVDVYVEYPFFVRGRGWSSCCPQRTVRLCGLQCHQLSVGDVCLALTPVSPPHPPPTATLEPDTSPRKTEGGRGPPHPQAAPPTQLHPAQDGPTGGKKREAEPIRRRRWSAPEPRGAGTNCAS